ncbi:cupin domain-containing protein [Mycobacterium sp. 3519A]|uniref:cupin domain-containing protein n=1 Tax=Mycobacterium sp. 3519A TaxID=2057184 RepID=UPI000C7D0C00|nr:cupin domain-containing protein [Mycobacterium sp. 3519A]
MNVRRVVTGHDASGKSVFVSDEVVSATPVMGLHRLWGGDTTPQFPDDGTMPEHRTYFPPIGGFRFGMFTIPPKAVAGSEIDPAETETEAPGLLRYMDPSDPGMHTTDTIDFEVVLEGTVILELDDGAEVVLNPGDTVVQNGTRHRWRNGGDTTARLAVFMCGASHSAVPAG